MADVENDSLAVVIGPSGFIGRHLIVDLRRGDHTRVRAVNVKPLEDV
jgi:nucleoside-diphosphate-sugar epimerase